MPQVLILHCDGTQRRATMSCAQDYQRAVRGPVEPLAHRCGDTERCYVNEQAIIRSLPCSRWSLLVRALGFLPQGTLRGDAVLCSSDARGFDSDVNERTGCAVDEYVTAENRSATLHNIELSICGEVPQVKPRDYNDWIAMTRLRRGK